MFSPGDKYIRFSKYGSIIIGVVDNYGTITNVDINNSVCYQVPTIKTTKGYVLKCDGSDGQIYKVTKEYSQTEVEELKKFLSLNKNEKLKIALNKRKDV